MNSFAILNANKEIMRLKVQTDYFCPRVDSISTSPTQAKPTCMDLTLSRPYVLHFGHLLEPHGYHWKVWLQAPWQQTRLS